MRAVLFAFNVWLRYLRPASRWEQDAKLGRAIILGAGIVAVAWMPQAGAQTVSDNSFKKPAIAYSDPVCSPYLTNGIVQQPAATLKMIELLAQLRRGQEANPAGVPYLSDLMAAAIRKSIARTTNEVQVVGLRVQLAAQLLLAGESEAALAEYDGSLEMALNIGMKVNSQNLKALGIQKALCYLRMGEQDNCITNHNSESCLLPIQGKGIHKIQRGSRGAIVVLTDHLKRFGDDLQARWLINIAYMTLGEYPEKVPPQWLVPPSAFESSYDIKRFPDVAGAVGLDVEQLGGGSIAEDFDGDGFLDLMLSPWDLRGRLRYFHNNGDGSFTDRTVGSGLRGLPGGLNMMQMDYNNDGHPDVFILRGAWLGSSGHLPNSLLRNNGNGTFTDVTEEAHLLSFHPTQTATWFDYDGDGFLDLFIGNETTPGDVHPCELYHNNGDGTFTECAAESGLGVTKFIKGVISGDFDNDGRPDLYLSNRAGPNMLFHNDGPAGPVGASGSRWRFTDVALAAGVTEPEYSFPAAFMDYDNDGWLDILVTGYRTHGVGDIAADYLGLPTMASKAKFYRNNHDGTFTDATVQVGLSKVIHAMGLNFGDLDNDGWLDFYAGTGDPDLGTLVPNRMFRNAGGKYFQEVTSSGGFGHIQKGHAISFADLDNDGDQDVYESIGGAFAGDIYRNSLFLNPGHGNHWITIKAEGVRSNRAALGARIRVVVDTAEGERSIYKTVCSGASFGSSPLRQEIGLGQAKEIKYLEIFWPATGVTQKLAGVTMDHFYKVRETDAGLALWDVKSFIMPTEGRPHAHTKAHNVTLLQ